MGCGYQLCADLSAEGSYAIVGLASGSAQSISVSVVKNGTYNDAVTGNSFTVASYSGGIYVLNGPGKIGLTGTYLR